MDVFGRPLLSSYRKISNTCGLGEECKLIGVLGTVYYIRDHCDSLTARRFHIITDSHVALQELNRTFSPN